jgi:hypothetical protein
VPFYLCTALVTPYVVEPTVILSIGSLPPPIVIMNTRPQFVALPSLLELCEALAFAAAQCAGMCVWHAAEALLASGIAWAWAVQGQDMQADMQGAFSCLMHGMLVTLCQCRLHRLASSAPFVSWSKQALAAISRGDGLQVVTSSAACGTPMCRSLSCVQLAQSRELYAAHSPHLQGRHHPL